jgi:uncharacterized membrane protein YgcG
LLFSFSRGRRAEPVFFYFLWFFHIFINFFEMNIFVAKLNFDTDSDRLREVFEGYGEVESAKVIMDRETGTSKGFGFVEMPNEDEANAAIEDLNENELDGNTIVVKKADDRSNDRGSNRGGGGYDRRGGGYDRRGGGGGGGRGGYDRRGGGGGGYDTEAAVAVATIAEVAVVVAMTAEVAAAVATIAEAVATIATGIKIAVVVTMRT